MNVNSVCLCVLVLSLLFECGHSNSPCPDIFNFITDGNDVFGQITLQPFETVSSLKIRIKYTVQAVLDDYLGHIVAPENVLQKYNRGETVSYRVYFPVISPRPKVTKIAVNDDEICTGPGDELIPNHVISLPSLQPTSSYGVGGGSPDCKKFQHQPQHDNSNSACLQFDGVNNSPRLTTARSTPTRTTSTAPVKRTRPEYRFSEECGVVTGGNEISRLIHNGLSYERGEIPWLVAIYHKDKKTLQFKCAGTLVSDRHVVTAAHCLQGARVRYSEKDIVVKLGVHDLNGSSDNIIVTAEVMAATINEFFNSTSLKNDLMILTLNKRVLFNDFIRPVCLWSGNTELLRVVGATGVVAGWGDDVLLDKPQMLRVPIVSNKECRASSPAFHKLTSHNTLCAGSRDGNGPCNGDSGGGLYLLDGGKWRLRGVVSLSLQNGNRASACNLNEYVVYTDTAQYLPWIRTVLSQKYFD